MECGEISPLWDCAERRGRLRFQHDRQFSYPTNRLAACACPPPFESGNVFCHSRHISEAAPFSQSRANGRAASGSLACVASGWLGAGGLGGFPESSADADSAKPLSDILAELHRKTAHWVNQLDGTKGRRVWHNFRETRLTYEKSYLARLTYCHQNAVKHGVVRVANQYPWCSAAWFERTARPAQVKTIYALPTDAVQITDDFDVPPL